MKREIIIVAPQEDMHANAVAGALKTEFSVNALLWDISKFPLETNASFSISNHHSLIYLEQEGRSVKFSDILSVWWRRPLPFLISDNVIDRKAKKYCLRECERFLLGTLESMDIPIINNPSRQISASRKPYQASCAVSVGLTIPDTLMTNDADAAKRFYEKYKGKCIYKPFDSPTWILAETRRMTGRDLEDIDNLKYAPIILQEEILPGRNLRVNVFGDKVYAAEIIVNKKYKGVDWRLDQSARCRAHLLPNTIVEKVKQLLKSLGLVYGCCDFILTEDGTYTFLEINPAGQFLFVEVDTGQPLARALAEILV